MSRTPRSRPTGAATAIGVVVGALALAGCGAGQVAQTAQQVTAVGGANAGAGSVAVRNVEIEFGEQVEGASVYPAGGDAPLQMSIVNSGTAADRLVSASSPAAASVEVTGDVEIPAGRLLTVEGEPAAAPAVPIVSGTARPTATPTTAEAAAGAQIVLTGLREDLRAGLTYPVTLTFERAGAVTLDVPVANPAEPREDEPAE